MLFLPIELHYTETAYHRLNRRFEQYEPFIVLIFGFDIFASLLWNYLFDTFVVKTQEDYKFYFYVLCY